MKKKISQLIILFIFLFIIQGNTITAQHQEESPDLTEIEKRIPEIMESAKIPGLSLIIIKGDQYTKIKNYGYEDLDTQQPVTSKTLFELGSNSKSFTALAILKLEKEKLLKLEDPVSKYFSQFYTLYKEEKQTITIWDLLHHTSGIPWETFAKIPEGIQPDALEEGIRRIRGIELFDKPGKGFLYCNTNYDILGAIIEKVTGMKYEDYMLKHIFRPLELNYTSVGQSIYKLPMATGYKIEFSKPTKYQAPRYRGNFPAGYVITNGIDMETWLKIQLGILDKGVGIEINRSHERNSKVLGSPYAKGWFILSEIQGEISHGGNNPNYSTYIIMKPEDKLAVAVLSNSNSAGTRIVCQEVFDHLLGKTTEKKLAITGSTLDKTFSLVFYILTALFGVAILLLFYIVFEIFRGTRAFEGIHLKKLLLIILSFIAIIPIVFGIYLIPEALAKVPWSFALVWAPVSFLYTVGILLAFLGMGNVIFIVSTLFPYKDKDSFSHKYARELPLILFLGFVSGIANAAAMFLISTSFFSPLLLIYLVFYFSLALYISILGRKIVQTKMVVITNNIVYELRMRLIGKIFSARFQNFEKIDSGRVYATLNNDTETIANSAGMVVSTITSAVTAAASFLYLSAISFPATLSTLLVAMLLGVFYIIVGKKSRVLMEEMRDTQNVFMKLIEGLVKGFREISMHYNKKVEYEMDVEASCDKYRKTRCSSIIKFINANLVSSSMILILLASICIGFPRIFPEMSLPRLISFIMVLLYMIGPITSIMASFPTFIRIKVSWDRINKFIDEIPAVEEQRAYKDIKKLSHKGETIQSFEAKNITFEYRGKEENEHFSVGPINLSLKQGEILFLIGGNGSGKTTLAKMITGLYQPEKGEILVNGKKISGDDFLSEYFSVIFDDFHLFEKMYNIDVKNKNLEIDEYLQLLGMKGKVELKGSEFSTINLSSGQRKRLALLQCKLEDCPIYLFDEVAADQDPEFRKFFYRNLLKKMKEEGKIVIAITHDDHYFDVADRIIKMDMGKIDTHPFEIKQEKVKS
jgi:putative ATP-binding cassette transporter